MPRLESNCAKIVGAYLNLFSGAAKLGVPPETGRRVAKQVAAASVALPTSISRTNRRDTDAKSRKQPRRLCRSTAVTRDSFAVLAKITVRFGSTLNA